MQSAARALRWIFLALLFCLSTAHAARPYVTAAVHWSGGKAQFFLSDGTYLRYDIAANRVDPDYPKPINDKTWPGMGRYATMITAGFNGGNGKIFFFLANGTYLRYDIAADSVDPGYPKLVDNGNWPGLGGYSRQLYGAVRWKNNRAYFILDNGTYLRYDLTANRVDPGYPKPINEQTWPGLQPYARQISSLINWDNDRVYIFLDNGTYLRYNVNADQVDPGYPKRIDDSTWPGMGSVFGRRYRSMP